MTQKPHGYASSGPTASTESPRASAGNSGPPQRRETVQSLRPEARGRAPDVQVTRCGSFDTSPPDNKLH
eukprot:9971379-Lingulodinium_polyedra.AAC.1